ncbi:bacillithiol biosynthesis cysteine-adding enzyme BshC [uncultured Croceitalea sp.]|uniref:bacillithiol biosynthesis cysteine-adding enzyme BshC n=1 Tax=uncultured Croceitalea sp. TaxID=1798908 RepID=UPI00374E7FC3
MEVDCIAFRETGYFSELICDYLDDKQELKSFYNRKPDLANFKGQLEEKAKNFPVSNRKVLVKALNVQYKEINTSETTFSNITSLGDKNTFTVVTGHQLNLFTGPLYFLYKIISTINLTEQLRQEYSEYNFVPVYWMATEDHDFDEINYFNFRRKKIQWNNNASGGVGRLSTEGLDAVLKVITNEFGETDNANYLKTLFQKAYLEHETLTAATRYLTNELFGEYGLVIIDGDDADLKRLLIPYAKKDIFEQLPYKIVSNSIEELIEVSEAYKIQVNPREINYFYLKDGLRERIIQKDGVYYVNDTVLTFTAEELQLELELHPERFSPNVIARPLYQEIILPNLCYIGGGGELAYWLELRAYFEALHITFPMLLLRNSALIITKKQNEKIEKLDLSVTNLFLKQNQLINKKIRKISNIDIDFSPQKKLINEQFADMYKLAEQTDKSFLGAVKAQEVKQKKGLDALEKRLLKAQKRKLKDHVLRITELQNQLFPNQSLQERQLNFSELYLEYGEALISNLMESLKPLKGAFTIHIKK